MSALVLDDFDTARKEAREATSLDPSFFEAWYALALIEFDSGNADAALEAALKASAVAPDGASKSAVQTLANEARPYSSSK